MVAIGCCFMTLKLRRVFIVKFNKGVVRLHIKKTVAPFLSYQDVIELSLHLRGPVAEPPPLPHSFLGCWPRAKLLSTITSSKYALFLLVSSNIVPGRLVQKVWCTIFQSLLPNICSVCLSEFQSSLLILIYFRDAV